MRSFLNPAPTVALAIILAGLAAAACPAQAQERPRYLPTRDVVVQYQISSNQPGVPPDVTAHISAAGQFRLDAGNQGTVLYDNGSPRARWVLPQGGIYMDLPVGGSLAGIFIPDANARFAREGGATVAGLRCTEWRVTVPRGSGTACVTADGVILRGEGSDQRGHTGTLVATSVAYAPQPPATFEPPPGARHLDIPSGLSLKQLRIPQ